MNALIGHTGFVGSNLVGKLPFDRFYNSSNIGEISGKEFEHVVCAGIQAKKWWANEHPEEDWARIENLISHLTKVKAKRFTLISTVDVYPSPVLVCELDPWPSKENHAYGRHRLLMEEFVSSTFSNSQILRLPGLFGEGLKKNVIFDLLTRNNLDKVNPLGCYQYYWLGNLARDIELLRGFAHPVLNVATEPLQTAEIAREVFGGISGLGAPVEGSVTYDMRSVYWEEWNSTVPGYLYTKTQVLEELKRFVGEHG